jgi:hypothetical protein
LRPGGRGNRRAHHHLQINFFTFGSLVIAISIVLAWLAGGVVVNPHRCAKSGATLFAGLPIRAVSRPIGCGQRVVAADDSGSGVSNDRPESNRKSRDDSICFYDPTWMPP